MPGGKFTANCSPISVKGWSAEALGHLGEASWSSRWFWVKVVSPVPFRTRIPRDRRSSSTGPQIPGHPSRQIPLSCAPPGTGRGGEDSPAARYPQDVQHPPPPTALGAPKPVWTGRLWYLLQELTPELESWPLPMLFLLVSPCTWEGRGCQGTGPHRINSSH